MSNGNGDNGNGDRTALILIAFIVGALLLIIWYKSMTGGN